VLSDALASAVSVNAFEFALLNDTQANAYLEAVRQSSEMALAEAFYKQNGYSPTSIP
jgi:hypothetical protein